MTLRAYAVAAACLVGSALVVSACSSSPASTPSASATTSAAYRWGVVGNKGAITQLELSRPTPVKGIGGTIVQIATSNSDGYALTSTGHVWGWGVNSYGELGDDKTTPYDTSAVEVDFPTGVKITSLANPMPFDAGLAIDSTGQAWGWGLNGDNDLCLTGLVVTRPQRVPLTDVTLATGARTHALFSSHGTVYGCGGGDAGELGNGSTSPTATPTPVMGLPAGEQVTALTSSWEGSGALLADGSYYNWGYNAQGQLGDGTTTSSSVPVKVNLPEGVTEVFQGGSGKKNGQTIAILSDGSVWTWGSNSMGQLGIGTRVQSTTPVKLHVPTGVSFVKVSSGGYASYAIDGSGRLWAWGSNSEGQLGTGGAKPFETLPVDVGTTLTQVSSTAQNVAGFR